ncbi:MAG: PLDc_N domain-containing protein [Bacteroidetes bacterium]|nr:PLDc_N domain-containing protein [Bacteroidota bacterium]
MGPELIIFFLILGGFAFWLAALISVIKAEFDHHSKKIVWLLMVILLPFIGTILYFLLGTKQRIENSEESYV